MRYSFLSTMAFAGLTLGVGLASAQHFDAALDWSYEANPSGAWSYRDGEGNLMETVENDWRSPGEFDPGGQSSWTDDGPTGVPAWMLSAGVAGGLDFPEGVIGAYGKATLRWTAPEDGDVTLSGGTWLMRNRGRSQEIQVIYNEETVFVRVPLLSDGEVGVKNNPFLDYDSFDPQRFSNAPGGEAALTFGVRAGDSVDVTNVHTGFNETYICYDVVIDFTPTANPLSPPTAVVIYDAARDFSYGQNPNGFWSYHDGHGDLMEKVVDDWLSPLDFAIGQRAWSNAGQGGVPGWMLSAGVANSDRIPDFPEGTLGTHGKSILRWTAPRYGDVVLSGGTWLPRNIGRSQSIEITYNGEIVFIQTPLPSEKPPTYTSDNPQSFSSSVRGESGLTFGVRPGDTIDFTNVQQGAGDDFVAYNVTIEFTPTYSDFRGQDRRVGPFKSPPRSLVGLAVYDCSNDWSDEANPNSVWSYHDGNGTLMEASVEDWSTPLDFMPGQRAWSNAGQQGGPACFKSVGVAQGKLLEMDLPIGTVGSHGPSTLRWTAPADGDVLLIGGTWLPRNIGTDVTVEASYNGTVFLSTPLASEDPPTFTSSSPRSFGDNPLGEGVLCFGVSADDKLDFAPTAGAKEFVAYDLRIEFTEGRTEPPPVLEGPTTYDLTEDWSWEENPNGPWSLHQGDKPERCSGRLMESVVENWSPIDFNEGQRAWTNAGRQGVPVWMKSAEVGRENRGLRFPEGAIGTHGDSVLRWTAPADGNVELVGGVWLFRNIGRSQDIVILYDHAIEIVTLELLSRAPPIWDHIDPMPFDLDVDTEVFTFGVRSGKTISFSAAHRGAGDDFVGFEIFINFTPTSNPLAEPGSPFETYNAAGTWSYDANPNGPWSYHDGAGNLLTTVVDDWLFPDDFDAGQRAWTNAGQVGVPGWMLSRGVGIDKDFPAGRVGTHGKSILRWTAPADGNIELSGGAWLLRNIGRAQEIRAIYNLTTPFIAIALDSRPPAELGFTSDTPRNFASGPNGEAALTFGVTAGDTVDFLNVELGAGDDFVGYDINIDFTPVDVPADLLPPPGAIVPLTESMTFDAAADWSYENNPNGLWSYRDGDGNLMREVADDWLPGDFDPGQRAWSNAGPTGVPGWTLSADVARGLDFPEGLVGTHGTSILRWTAPQSGDVTIEGGCWLLRDIGRSQIIRCSFNSMVDVFRLDLPSEAPAFYTSADPKFFEEGPAGIDVLTFGVRAGDTLDFQNDQQGNGDDFIGYSVEIGFTPTDNPLPPPGEVEVCDNGVDDDDDGEIDDGDADCQVQGVGPFLRGDCDGNGTVGGSPTEAIVLLDFAFRGGEQPGCLAACDAEANGSIGITDALRILRHSFLGVGEPDAPFPVCVVSALETDVALGCGLPFCVE